MSVSEPGFYPDPTDPSQLRYWDGARWTSRHTGAPGGAAASGVRAERSHVAPAPAVKRPAAEGRRWTAFVLAAVFAAAFFAAFAIPSGWQPREFPDWFTAEWDESGRRVFPPDEELTAALDDMLSHIDAAEQIMIRFAEAADEPAEVILDLLELGDLAGDAADSLEEIEAAATLAERAREDLRGPLAALARLSVPDDLVPAVQSYLEHGRAWDAFLGRFSGGPAELLSDARTLENLGFSIESSGNTFSLELVELLLSGRIGADAVARAVATLELGFEGSQGLALYRFETRRTPAGGQWVLVGECLVETDGDLWEPAPCFDHHAEVVHVARAVSSASRCPAGSDVSFTDEWGLYCTLVISDDTSSGGNWGVGPLTAGSCVGFDRFGDMTKTLCGRYGGGVELTVVEVAPSEELCMTEQNYRRYEGEYYVSLPAFDGARQFLCFDAVAWERAGLPLVEQ